MFGLYLNYPRAPPGQHGELCYEQRKNNGGIAGGCDWLCRQPQQNRKVVLRKRLCLHAGICVYRYAQDERTLALCGESLDHGFSNIEFWGGYAAPPVETVQQLLRAAGIAQQVTLYFPFPWMAALTAYALCPAGLVLLAAARTLGGRVRRGCPKETCWFVLGGAFLLALVLPALLRLLPPWITPARWSDFSYWGGLLPAVGKAIETGFSLNPCAKDVLAKWNTLGLLIAATLANAAAGKLMLSRQQKNSTNL